MRFDAPTLHFSLTPGSFTFLAIFVNHEILAAISLSFRVAPLCPSFTPLPRGVDRSANEKLFGIACRSVHLGYPAHEGPPFITKSGRNNLRRLLFHGLRLVRRLLRHAGTWNGQKADALFGLGSPIKVISKSVQQEERVACSQRYEKVRTNRFGGEGPAAEKFVLRSTIGEPTRPIVSTSQRARTPSAPNTQVIFSCPKTRHGSISTPPPPLPAGNTLGAIIGSSRILNGQNLRHPNPSCQFGNDSVE